MKRLLRRLLNFLDRKFPDKLFVRQDDWDRLIARMDRWTAELEMIRAQEAEVDKQLAQIKATINNMNVFMGLKTPQEAGGMFQR